MDKLDYILQTKDLSIGYGSGKRQHVILDEISLSIRKGRFIALLGANGVGKSTLIRTLAGLQNPLGGEILLADKAIKAYEAKSLARKISLVLTDSIQAGHFNVQQLVEMGRYPYTNWTGRLEQADHQKVEEAIQLCGIAYLKKANIFEISDGQKQIALIARALAQDGQLMLLDEPTVHLDANNRYAVMQLLRKLVNETHKSILISTHQVELAIEMADELWLANCGEKIKIGTPEDLMNNNEIKKMFPFLKY